MEQLRYNYGNYTIPADVHGGIAVDIGCNNGTFLLKNKNIFSKIHAYEPNKGLFDLLQKVHNEQHITIFNNALDSVDGNIVNLAKYTFNDDDGSYGIYTE